MRAAKVTAGPASCAILELGEPSQLTSSERSPMLQLQR
ncbi:hypothetical protein ART_1738 [Arthrobacter sp. PAMC 25486]|nr:hypothetical protein ART_1738 [Arthrobacter sp. PAMC 25486]